MKNFIATYEKQNGEQKLVKIKAINAVQGLMKGLALREKELKEYTLTQIEPEEQ